MNDYELKAFVTNLGKYNEGELVGEWVSFPVSADEMKAILDRIQIGHPDDLGIPYEEIFITDYDTDIYGLQNLLGEFTSLEELNYLAGRLDEMSTYEVDKFKAVLESGIDIEESGLSGIINLTYSLDKYEIMPDISDEYDLGYYWVHDSGVYDIKRMGPLADYIDYQAFGESIVDEEFGMFCEAGYVRDNGDSWNYEYAGDRDDIPSEYRLFNSEEEPEMTVLVVEPGKEPKVITMGTDLESLQHAVNGYIQAVYPFEDRVAVICNDEGKINGMELNRALYTPEGEMYDILAGPFIVAGLTEDNFGSLTQEQIEKFSELFRTPEMFLMENGRITREFQGEAFFSLDTQILNEMGLRAVRPHDNYLESRTGIVKIKPFEGNAVITLENFTYSYGKHKVLHIDKLEIPKGSVTAIAGHNGAGKSTFTKCLCGLQKGFKGRVMIDGRTYKSKDMIKLSYMVMQDVNHQLFAETVLEEVMLGADDSARQQAIEILQKLNIAEYQDRHPMSLSGGQKQRIAVASALLAGKKLLVFDEPTSGLDFRSMKCTAELLQSLDTDITVLIVTHDMELIECCCTHILHIENGKI